MRFKPHLSRFSSWVIWLLSALLITTGGTIGLTRILDRDRTNCLATATYHIFDVYHDRDVQVPRPPKRDEVVSIWDRPYPSPDGKYVVHEKSEGGENYITLSNADGSNDLLINKELTTFLGWSADSRYFTIKNPYAQNGMQAAAIWSSADRQVVMFLDTVSVDWSPTGHLFSYAVEGGLRVVNPENVTTTTYHLRVPPSFSYATWSPNGNYIAVINEDFSRTQDGIYFHTVINLDSGQYFQQTSASTRERSYLWQNDFWMKDSSVYFFVQVRQIHDHVQSDLVALNPVTGALTTIMPDVYSFNAFDLASPYLVYTFIDKRKWSVETLDLETGQRNALLTRADRLLTTPTWSNDGKWIAVVEAEANDTNALDRVHVVVAHPDGTQARNISDVAKDWAILGWTTWQPNWLSYATDTNIGVQLMLVDLDSGTSYPVLDHLSRNTFFGGWSVIFSPNKQMALIGFKNSIAGYDTVYLVSLDGSSKFKFSQKYVYPYVVWSPDSTAVAFRTSNGASELVVVSADGAVLSTERETIEGIMEWTNCQPPLSETPYS